MSSRQHTTCPIHRHARVRPDALALWSPSRRWSYSDLDRAIEATRTRMRESGIESERRVGLCLPRSSEMVILLWALWREGAVAVPLSTRLPDAEVGEQARRVGATILVAAESAILRAVPDGMEAHPASVLVDTARKGIPEPSPLALERPATIVFTSGSTGTPKAALHTWSNHVYNAKGSNANIPVREGDRWLLSLPLYHVGGLSILIRCALAGGAVAVPERKKKLSLALEAAGATHVSLVATQLRQLLDVEEGSAPGRLRALLLGGGPLPERLLRRGHARGWPLHASYGCTEMASQITTTPPGASLDELLTAGRCLPHRDLHIDDEGQILVSGPPLFQGYVDGNSLRIPRINDGWYPTGDLGHLDAWGRLRVRGRKDRLFISGGENIHPEEIEAALERLDRIEKAVVVPVPDAEYGQRPVAFVQTDHGALPSQWEDRLGTILPSFKIPDAMYRLPESGATDQGTIDRKALQQQAVLSRT